jgi:hypothetical protein
LRFTRDKRGYETTSLVHAIRRQGRSRQRILYWFRTPPDVKVGRPALDEEAIRTIEEQNPDIEFNWQKILEAKASPPPPVEDMRHRRPRRDRPERAKPVPQAAQTAEPEIAEQGIVEEPEEQVVEAIEQLTHPDAEEKIDAPLTPAEHAIGREPLVRLRARFAELQARITERGGDAERIGALRLAAEPLNPDTWVTEDEARKGVEEFEAKIRDLRAALGLRRRRRSRRGGRGHRTTERSENGAAPDTEKGEGQ